MASEEIVTDRNTVNISENIIINKIFRRIKNKWWLFVLIGFLGAIGGYFYALSHRTEYQSYLSFALDEGGSEGGSSAALGLAAQFGISLGGSQNIFAGDNILDIIESRRMIEGTLLSVDTFDNKPMTLIEFYLQNERINSPRTKTSSIHFYPGESRDTFSYAKDSLLYNTYLVFSQRNIIARRPDKRLNIYELLVTSHNEKFSKVFTDKLMEETNSFYTQIRSKKAGETLQILEKRVPDMKQKLDASIANKAAIQDANLNTPFANAEVPLLKQQSNAQVYSAAYAEMFKNLEVARFQYLQSIPLLQIIDAANYPMKKVKPGKLKMAVIFSVLSVFISLIIFISISTFVKRRG
jgi:uncharacterized protein involved in exopolysaccharide biosynthesis